MLPQRADIVVDRLRLKGTAEQQPVLRHEVETTDWPRQPPQAWIIVREVRARAPRGWLSRRLTENARQAVDAAVSPDHPNAGSAPAIRFDTLADLLARLSADLVSGHAAGRWYWQHWRRLFGRPLAAALSTVWQEQVAHLPAVTARLHELGALPPVWAALDGDAATQLLTAYAHHAGVRLSAAPAPAEGETASSIDMLPTHLVERWASALSDLPPDDPRRMLAALLAAVEWRPVRLREVQPLARLRTVSAALAAVPSKSADGRAPLATGAEPKSQLGRPAGTVEKAMAADTAGNALFVAGESGKAPVRESGSEPRVDAAPYPEQPPNAPEPADTALGRRDVVLPPDQTAQQLDQAESVPRRDLPNRAEPPAAAKYIPPAIDGWLQTGFGGLFYLINALNHPLVSRLLADNGAWRTLPDGWVWLYRLGRELGFDTSDPLARFLAQQLGLEQPDALQELPPLPHRRELLALLDRLYTDKGLWTPELLAVPARLAHTASHLDLYFGMNAVRLPVRLAGLDVDPGWVPWLGRVVTFHYTEAGP